MQARYSARFAIDPPLVVQGVGAAEADRAGQPGILLVDLGAAEPDPSSSKELVGQVCEAMKLQAPGVTLMSIQLWNFLSVRRPGPLGGRSCRAHCSNSSWLLKLSKRTWVQASWAYGTIAQPKPKPSQLLYRSKRQPPPWALSRVARMPTTIMARIVTR